MTSFLKKFAAMFEKLFGSAPQWIHYAQVVVTFLAPLTTAAITMFAPEVLPIAGPIMAEVQADLATVSTLTADGTATPSLAAAIQRIQANLTALMAAGHIKDATLQANITLAVNELAALASMLPTSTTPVATS
jgi:uncharacterized protein involved in cysteine biosynthesis